MCKHDEINCVPQMDNNASGPLTLSDCRLIHVVFIPTALDEGDIALLKTYVSISVMKSAITESHVRKRVKFVQSNVVLVVLHR